LVVSDDHAGLKAAIREVLSEAVCRPPRIDDNCAIFGRGELNARFGLEDQTGAEMPAHPFASRPSDLEADQRVGPFLRISSSR
jgi:hypothetical protein